MRIRHLFFLVTVTFMLSCVGSGDKTPSFSPVMPEDEIPSESVEAELSDEESQMEWVDANHNEYDPKTTVFFSHVFIYQYRSEDEPENEGEFWIYHNPETGNLLYDPGDEMIDFVISSPDGNYYFFGNDGHGIQTVTHQHVDWVTHQDDDSKTYPVSDDYVRFSKTGRKFNVDGSVDGKQILSEEYRWEFVKVQGNQTTAVTEQIPVNFYQMYGFNKIDGDVSLPVNFFDFTGIFSKEQTVTHFESDGFQMELIAYQYNPYFAEAGDYTFSVYEGDGNWKEEHLPLLEK